MLCSYLCGFEQPDLLTGQLSQIDNVKYQRLDTLSRILRCGDGMRDAYHWIQQTKQAGGFRGPVYGPILLEVECHNALHTSYLENQVGSKDLIYHSLSLHTLVVLPAACAKLMRSSSADCDRCISHIMYIFP